MPVFEKIKTWVCLCGYKQDFKSDVCPSCAGKLVLSKSSSERIDVVISLVSEIDENKELTKSQKAELKQNRLQSIANLEDKIV